jgi:threonine/homoserine/homoserine lactone efflux protein
VGDVIAFLGVSALVITTPGPDTALTIRNTIGGRRPAGIATALGVASGQAVWTLAAAAGVAAVIVASQEAFLLLRIVGASYLILLGFRTIWRAWFGRATPQEEPRGSAVPPPIAFRQGLISNLANPKMVAFFTSIFPQFTPAGSPAFPVLLVMGLAFCAMTFLWLSAYVTLVVRAGASFRRSRIRRGLEALLGTVLVALGVRLALTHE